MKDVKVSKSLRKSDDKRVKNFVEFETYVVAGSKDEPTPYEVMEDLGKIVTGTNAWSPIIWDEKTRKAENFLRATAMVLDVDDGLPMEDAKKLAKDYNYIIAPSINHQKEKIKVSKKGEHIVVPPCDRYRVVIPAEEPIDDIDVYSFNMEIMIKQYQGDKSCGDGARYYFPCKSIYAINSSGKNFTWMRPSDQELIDRKNQRIEKAINRDMIGALSQEAFMVCRNEFKYAEGDRHMLLFRTAAGLARFGVEEDKAQDILINCELGMELIDEKGEDEIIRNIANGFRAGNAWRNEVNG